MEQDVPVRVVRGHKCANSYVGKVYTYDGMYKVVDLRVLLTCLMLFLVKPY